MTDGNENRKNILDASPIHPDVKNPALEVPNGQIYQPPEGIKTFDAFKELIEFWPNDQWMRDDCSWVAPYEQHHFMALGYELAHIFGVDLMNDAEYLTGTEEQHMSSLTALVTRSSMKQTRPGIWEWMPLVVVVRKMIVVGIQVRLDPANNVCEWPMCLLWSNIKHEYVPIVDPAAGKIENPFVITRHILPIYIEKEKIFERNKED